MYIVCPSGYLRIQVLALYMYAYSNYTSTFFLQICPITMHWKAMRKRTSAISLQSPIKWVSPTFSILALTAYPWSEIYYLSFKLLQTLLQGREHRPFRSPWSSGFANTCVTRITVSFRKLIFGRWGNPYNVHRSDGSCSRRVSLLLSFVSLS